MKQRIPIILASASPRRKDLMQQMGLKFSVEVFPTDEKNTIEDPKRKVLAIVEQKMNAVIEGLSQKTLSENCVVCADTVVVIGKAVLGKAQSKDEARKMLHALSGKTHEVMTAFEVNDRNKVKISEAIVTQVEFMKLSDDMIENYISTQEYIDKAGSYAIQGLAGSYVKSINGSYSNVIGLPQVQLMQAFKRLGIIAF